MNNKDFIESGILEEYVLGYASAAERVEVERRAAGDPAIRQEIVAIEITLEKMALAGAMAPDPIVKPFLMATIDYTSRLEKGEAISYPPLLNEKSTLKEYELWLNRADMVSPGTEDVYAKIIGYTPEAISAIVWLKNYAPSEVHNDEHERFLIVEGTCDIIVEDEINHLVPGDHFAIPLFKDHLIKVTSSFPCKVILQRVAA